MNRALAIAALAACSGRDATPAPVIEPLPPAELVVDVGRQPIINPLNLWDLLIDGTAELDVVGVIAGQPITTKDLDDRTGQVLTRIGDRIYDARDAGWRWLVEREGLRRAAGARSIAALLADGIATLPAPDDAALAPYLRRDDVAALAGEDRGAAAITLWRWDAWRIRRSMRIVRGLDGVTVGRRQLMLIDRDLTRPGAMVGDLGDRPITRQELHLAAGYAEQLARQEYVDAARIAFDELARERLLAGQPPVVVPPPTDADIDAWIAAHPEYATAENGRGRAREDVRTLRQVAAQDALVARLSAHGSVAFHLVRPPFEPIPPDVDAPRIAGAAGASHTLEVLHCVGTATCALGMQVVGAILAELGDELRVEAGDYFEQPRLTTVRGALALRCAEEQGRGWPLAVALGAGDPAASIAAIEAHVAAVGADLIAFRSCFASDRWLPTIFENVTRAQVLGLELNVLGMWVDGVRVDDVGSPAGAVAGVRAALH